MIYLLHQAIEEHARIRPNQDAFRHNGKGISYRELDIRANRLANKLRALGVGTGDRVGIYMNKCLEMPVAVFGIMKAGAAYVPLDPSAPTDRLAFILAHCGIDVLISHKNKTPRLAELAAGRTLKGIIGVHQAEIAAPTFSWAQVEEISAAHPDVSLMEDDLAYIMYTSGSTGVPKGIMHTHASGLSYARGAADLYGLNPGDRLGNHSPLHFDMSTLEFFSGPLVGATTVLIPREYAKLPASMAGLIEKERLTIWYSVPFALIQLLLRGAIENRDLSSLRWILYGGESFPIKYLRDLMNRLPGARYGNVYGPAEVNQCTFYLLPTPLPRDMVNVPLGSMWDNATGLILDENDREVPPGEAGELVVRTPTMMQGYWNRPDLNEKAFFRDSPFPGYTRAYYRTGDLVLRGEDGLMYFVGRKDRQIKTRGYRVELDEIEAALATCPEVLEAAAFSGEIFEGSASVEAAVTLKEGQQADANGLIAVLKEKLPWYAVPRQVHLLDSFPRTATGKIDRRALEALRNMQ